MNDNLPEMPERSLFPSYTLSVLVLGVFGFVLGMVLITEGQPRNQALPAGIVVVVISLIAIFGFVPFITYVDDRAERKWRQQHTEHASE